MLVCLHVLDIYTQTCIHTTHTVRGREGARRGQNTTQKVLCAIGLLPMEVRQLGKERRACAALHARAMHAGCMVL